MKILVIGGAGYVGSVLVPKLDKLGYDVDVIDLLWFGNNLPSNINVIQKNAFDLTVDELKKYEQVIFMAGLSNDPMAEFSPKQNFIENSALPSYVAYISKEAGVKRFIFASSCSIYGYDNNKLFNESDLTRCSYPYGISKIQAENAIRNLNDQGFSTICLRKGTISGYSPRMRFDIVINAMFKSAILTNKIIVNDPHAWRPILSVEDAANAYIKSIEANKLIYGVFNIAYLNYTIVDLALEIKEIFEKKYGFNKISIEVSGNKDFRSYKADVGSSIMNLKVDYRESVKDIINSLFLNREEFGNFDNPNYYNIEVFKNLKF